MNLAELLASYVALPGLRANFVVNLEGDFSDSNGSSRGISTPEDKALLVHLRKLSDVVLVSAATASIEQLSSTAATALAVVVGARSLETFPALEPSENDVYVFTPTLASKDHPLVGATTVKHVSVVNQGIDRITPVELLGATRSLGFTSLLSEFGPTWLGALVEENAVDELCLTVTKSGGQNFTDETPEYAMEKLLPGSSLRLFESIELGDNLFTRWRAQETSAASL